MNNDLQLLRALYERLPDLLPGFNPHDPATAPDLNDLPTLQRIVVGALEQLADNADTERAQLSALYMLGCLKGMRHVARRLLDLADATASEQVKASALYVAARGLDLLKMSPFTLRPPGVGQAAGGGLSLNPSIPLPSVPSPAAAANRPPLPRAPIPPKPRTRPSQTKETPPQRENTHPQAETAEEPPQHDNSLPPQAGEDVAQRSEFLPSRAGEMSRSDRGGAPARLPTDPHPAPPAEQHHPPHPPTAPQPPTDPDCPPHRAPGAPAPSSSSTPPNAPRPAAAPADPEAAKFLLPTAGAVAQRSECSPPASEGRCRRSEFSPPACGGRCRNATEGGCPYPGGSARSSSADSSSTAADCSGITNSCPTYSASASASERLL